MNATNNIKPAKASNLVIIGQGAIGLLWYANFHLKQQSISANKRSINLSLLSSNESFTSNRYFDYLASDGQTHQVPLNHARVKQLEQADIILLCVKSYQVAQAYQQYQLSQYPQAILVLCHNGLGTLDDIKALPNATKSQSVVKEKALSKIAAITLTHGAKKTFEQGKITVQHTGQGFVDLGKMLGNFSAQEKDQLSKQLSVALETNWQEDFTKRLWLKLAVNAVINPLTAIYNIDNGEINNEQFTEVIDGILAEVCSIAETQQLQFSREELTTLVRDVAKKTAKNCSSMRADVLAGKTTEIDYINGYIVRLAKEHSVTVPANERLIEQVKALNNKSSL